MFVRIWQYEVPADRVDSFIAAYGPAGDWARLFARSDEFVRTELYRSTDAPSRFLTVDVWASRLAWQAFMDRWGSAYAELDAGLESLAAGGTLVVRGTTS